MVEMKVAVRVEEPTDWVNSYTQLCIYLYHSNSHDVRHLCCYYAVCRAHGHRVPAITKILESDWSVLTVVIQYTQTCAQVMTQ